MAVSAPQPQDFPPPRGQVPCSYHPDVMTGLRCSRCGKPICPRCGVRTPVGLRCPDCAGVRGLPTYRTSSSALLKAGAVGLAVAVVVGVVWGLLPEWQFYLALALGFGTAEAMAKAANYKRGRDLQVVGIAMVVVGLVLARVIMAQRFGVTMEQINALEPLIYNQEIADEFDGPVSAARAVQIRLIPDVLFAAIAVVIPWIRFR
jgi:hypothetical protein